MVSFPHEHNIFCSGTKLDDITHEQTFICRQLFAGHVVGSRPMRWKKNLQRMIISIIVQLISFLSTTTMSGLLCSIFLLIPPQNQTSDKVSSQHIYQPHRVPTREKKKIRSIRIADGVFFTCEKNNTSNQKPQRCVSFTPKLPPFIGA